MSEVDLNEAQAAAVSHARGPLLVFAGAGSGKTRVITYRIASLLSQTKVAPWRVLAVTFTNKAAGEMRSRLERLCGADLARSLWVGTFHATCAKLLRIHGAGVGVQPNFLIYDAADQKAVVARALADLNLDERRYPPRAVLAHIHKHKQEGRGPEEASAHSYIDEIALRIFRAYEERLRAANAVDFEDLILLTARLLDGSPEADRIRNRFDYVLVDEFQDTNATQYRFLSRLAQHHRNLCVVGDDDQSIYSWRGADVRNIRRFRSDYPEAAVVKLEQNYRSTQRIVSAALGVIRRSKEREPKELWTANGEGSPVRVVLTRDERDEAGLVVETIRRARSEGTTLQEMAVFYRIHAQSRVLEEALRAADIPYQIIGGTKFYDRAEVKDALAYLRILVNPRSDVDLARVVNVPARGIGHSTIDRLTAWATAHGMSLHEALAHVGEIDDLASAAKKKLTAFRVLLQSLQAEGEATAPSLLLDRVLSLTGYVTTLREEDSPEADARIENLQELGGSMRDYENEAEAAGEAPTLAGFLERVTLVNDVDGLEDGGRVVLMTVHGAKGLEFEHVVLTGMEEEMFPYKGVDPSESEELEEERRLAYVAITRARRHLLMTHTQMRQIFGRTRWTRPSRFLAELPANVAEHSSSAAVGSTARTIPYVERDEPRSIGDGVPWRHPQGSEVDVDVAPLNALPRRPPGKLEPGGRYVDTSFFDDRPKDVTEMGLRKGSRVAHQRFGEGKVMHVLGDGEPAVIAFFPGWGEKKILARFLKLA
jgi:DNA helicase II / ATP-dependent DNA helicase PcrA